ncbi:MAG TPA: hypothetical protein VMS17_24640 [Gemmataceae bacterium]|nr:hypothetical protein [Gemmataceae bacterium]
MSSNRDYLRRDRPTPGEHPYDEDYDDRFRRPRYASRYGMTQDEDHLRILSVLYYVLGGLTLLGGMVPLVFVMIGVIILNSPAGGAGGAEEAAWFFMGIGGLIGVLLLVQAVCNFLAGAFLSQRRHYVFCFVMACLACLHMPLGTILGVFTLLVLSRPTVKEMFSMGPPEAP